MMCTLAAMLGGKTATCVYTMVNSLYEMARLTTCLRSSSVLMFLSSAWPPTSLYPHACVIQ